LAVGLAPESLSRFGCVEGADRLDGLTGLVSTEEIERRLPQRRKLVLLLLAHSPSFTPMGASRPPHAPIDPIHQPLPLPPPPPHHHSAGPARWRPPPPPQRNLAASAKRSTRSACGSSAAITAWFSCPPSLAASTCATSATACANPSSVGMSPAPPFMTTRSKRRVYTKPCGRPWLLQMCTRCVRRQPFSRVSTHEPATAPVRPATRQSLATTDPIASGRRSSHGAGALNVSGVPASTTWVNGAANSRAGNSPLPDPADVSG